MSDEGDADRSSDADDVDADAAAEHADADRSRRRWWPQGRRGIALAGLLLLVVVAFGSWLGFEATHAKSSLEQARGDAQRAKEALSSGNTPEAAKWVQGAISNSEKAQDATHSVPWTIASALPWLGSPFKAAQQISEVVLGLATDVLRPSVQVGQAISPDRLLVDGRLDVQGLRNAGPQLGEISTAATKLDAQADAIVEPSFLSSVRDARAALQAQTADLSGLLEKTALAARVAPAMMGADGPRTYFMGFQTNAEARGTGGLLGGFGVLRFDNGKPAVDKLGQNVQLDRAFTPIDLGPEFAKRYVSGNSTTDFRNSNRSSHFPHAARIWQSMWEQESGVKVDGVVAIDPVALSYILGAVGPVTMPDGETITQDNVVELTESIAYIRFPDDQIARKQYLQDVASEVVKKMTGPVPSPRQLLDALGKAVSEGRIAAWSSNPAEQQVLEQTPLAHAVPDDPAPYAAVIVNNLSGNKLDYYLTRQIEYSAEACDSETRKTTVTVRLTNNVPYVPLPDYVVAQLGLVDERIQAKVPKGYNATAVTLLATKGATLTAASVNGEKSPFIKYAEQGHPAYELQVLVPPQQTVELKFELSEPTSPGAPRVPIQPLQDNPVPVVSVPVCPS